MSKGYSEGSPKSCLFVILALVLVGGGIYWVVTFFGGIQEKGKQLIADVISPYLTAIQDENYEAAFAFLASSKPIAEWESVVRDGYNGRGKLKRWEYPGFTNPIHELGRASFYRIRMHVFVGESSDLTVLVFDIQDYETENPKIRAIYERRMTGDLTPVDDW